VKLKVGITVSRSMGFLAGGALAALASLTLAAPAAADTVSCSFDESTPGTVHVAVTPSGDGSATMIDALFSPQIRVAAAGHPSENCGNGTLNNTGLISVADASAGMKGRVGVFYVPIGHAPVFAPGSVDEPGNSDEIPIKVDFGPGRDTLGLDGLHGDLGPLDVRMGAIGAQRLINLNAGEATGLDWDISMKGVDFINLTGAPGNNDDRVKATGGAATGNAILPISTYMYGFGGDDLFVGGSKFDQLVGAQGADRLFGKGARDELMGGSGPDLERGGGGPDDLMGDGGHDRLFGNSQADGLKGGGGPDGLWGGNGPDRLWGGNAPDRLHGGRGRDRLFGGRGPDLIIGGPGFDRCVGGPGHDVFKGCEVVKQ